MLWCLLTPRPGGAILRLMAKPRKSADSPASAGAASSDEKPRGPGRPLRKSPVDSTPGEKPGSSIPAEQPEAPAPVVVGQVECRAVYAVLGELEAWIASAVWKCSRDTARRIFVYSPEEVGLLVEPTALVLNKHLPAVLTDWKEELSLVLFLISIHQQKIQSMIALMKAERERATASQQTASTDQAKVEPVQ